VTLSKPNLKYECQTRTTLRQWLTYIPTLGIHGRLEYMAERLSRSSAISSILWRTTMWLPIADIWIISPKSFVRLLSHSKVRRTLEALRQLQILDPLLLGGDVKRIADEWAWRRSWRIRSRWFLAPHQCKNGSDNRTGQKGEK
jgi:hypothetical protein